MIQSGTTRIIWAFSNNRPATFQSALGYHSTFRGGKSLHLLDRGVIPTLPADAEHVDLRMDVSVPTGDFATAYFCKAFKLPSTDTKQHIVQGLPIITPGNEALVHHIVLYECNDLTEQQLQLDGLCYVDNNMPNLVNNCEEKMFFTWTIGGSGTFFPEEAGFPFGGPSDTRFVMMEVHYDNPSRVPFTDTSGIRLSFTPTLRRFDAAVLNVGRIVDPVSMAIPAGQSTYTIDGWCPSECTSQWNQPELNIVSTTFHSHLAGRALTLRHIRDGRELPPIAFDAHFDFNFQGKDPTRYPSLSTR